MNKLSFSGDLYYSEPIDGSVLKDYNLCINLEGALTETCEPAKSKVNLSIYDYPLSSIFSTQVIAANLANNHIMDYGIEGLEYTKKWLEKQNVWHFGAGADEQVMKNISFISFEGTKLALIGYVKIGLSTQYTSKHLPGVRYPNKDSVVEDIAECKRNQVNRIIISIHWGVEEVYLPTPEDIELAHFMIDSGADLIIGHHSHCIQPWEIYKGKYIFYGLGNLYFSDLNIGCFFNEKGESKRLYKKKQRYWNKESLLIHFSPDADEVVIQHAKYQSRKISLGEIIKRKYKLPINNIITYKLRFKISYCYGKIRKVLFNIVSNPLMLLDIMTYKMYYNNWKEFRWKA